MNNLGQMMKQAQEMQAKMAELQARMEHVELTGTAGAGLVSITLNGKGEIRRVSIDPSLAKPDEVEVLQDLIAAAANDARAKVEARMQEETRQLMGGLGLPPGLNLPF